MGFIQLIIIIGVIIVSTVIFCLLILQGGRSPKKVLKPGTQTYTEAIEESVEHIFNDKFREELRNRSRLHLEKIINENALSLQQDLRATTAQLNAYIKQEIKSVLQEEFKKYEVSITEAKQLAVDSIAKTQATIVQQRQILEEQLSQEVAAKKTQLITHFKHNMAEIINHYVLAAIGNQLDLGDQLDYIMAAIEDNKQAILEDLTHGA